MAFFPHFMKYTSLHSLARVCVCEGVSIPDSTCLACRTFVRCLVPSLAY